jgi:hypothetical protein
MTAAFLRAKEAGEMTWNGVRFEYVRSNDLRVADVVCLRSNGSGLMQCHVIATDDGTRGDAATLRTTVYAITTSELEVRINDNRLLWRATQVGAKSREGGVGADDTTKKKSRKKRKKKVRPPTCSCMSNAKPKQSYPNPHHRK